MAAFNKFNDFTEQEARGVHNFGSHVFKVALTNVAPVAANTMLADITQIAAGNGYAAGGTATTIGVSETGGTTTITGTAVTFTASGGSIGPFQYAVLYNDSATSPADALVAWWDRGSPVTLADGDSIVITFGGASPGTIFTKA
jgi:hypothetical protein